MLDRITRLLTSFFCGYDKSHEMPTDTQYTTKAKVRQLLQLIYVEKHWHKMAGKILKIKNQAIIKMASCVCLLSSVIIIQ